MASIIAKLPSSMPVVMNGRNMPCGIVELALPAIGGGVLVWLGWGGVVWCGVGWGGVGWWRECKLLEVVLVAVVGVI
ncbi:Hypothetical predicted protein [Olea europaea subsp. europaea]|uniref:Transmembrane protein n=1 Tax=Olea europaea subsp. europaea TaxID=158383 RepID=A0A8S0T527_OLEEU|nr:Hypothetical predicted protein [Olea europaea subsp. europaea]